MKKNIVFLFSLLLVSFASCSFINKKFENPDKDKLLMETLFYVIKNGHYNPVDINEEYSERVYKSYINYLDPQKRFFLQSDITEFEKHKKNMGEYLTNLDVSFFNLTYNRLMQRQKEAEKIYKDVLNKPFDFSKEEVINLDYENLPFSKNEKELKERWRKMLKFFTLSNFVIKEKEEATKKEKDANYKPKTEEELKKETTETTRKNFEDVFAVTSDMNRDDWFGMYLNSYAEGFDPHTTYFAPDLKERFDRDMSGKFEGIGATLQKKTEGIQITSIIAGGPVWKGKLLEVDDIILKVGEGNKEPVDVVGMRLEDAIKLIKGPKGTEVRLTVKKTDGTITVIPIVRDVVEIEETYAKSTLVKEGNKTYGLIHLPKFYVDFNSYKERNAASDMALEIAKMKAQNVSGLILDLRDNGGGSLKAVVDIAGLFIKEGPVVQVRSANGSVQVLQDTDKNIQWEKPLVILVNELSASASEILSAAMQDYKRAIVIGSKQTYGKGTVQAMVNLNQYVRNSNFDLGSSKLTIQKFYRIDGSSTQLEGVKSDVVTPDKYKYMEVGERELEFPLPWDKIQSAKYTRWTDNAKFELAIVNSNKRIAEHPTFKLIDENAKWLKEKSDNNFFPLNYTAYKKQLEEEEEKTKQLKNALENASVVKCTPLPNEEEQMKTDEAFKQRRTRWYESLEKDLYVEEAIKVLNDLAI